MKFTFRYFLYTLVLIGFVTFTFTLCSKQVVHPLFQDRPEFQDGVMYQKTHEAKIKANIERFLEKLLGKKLFVVSVLAELHDKYVNELEIQKDPIVVSENKSVNVVSSFKDDALDYRLQRPGVEAIRDQLKAQVSTPLSIDTLMSPVIDLPGFPTIETDDSLSVNEDGFSDSQLSGLTPQRELRFQNSRDLENNTLIVSEKKIESRYMKNKIKKLNVSVVIDKDYFGYLDITPSDLEVLITSVSGIDTLRGDTITVSYIPFVNKGFSWTYFVKRNKVWLEKFILVYNKLKPFLFGMLLIILSVAALVGGRYLVLWLLRKRKKIEKNHLLQSKEDEEKEKEEKMNEIEEKRQAILQLAQTKPDQFNMLISSWMEVDRLERN